MPDYIFRPAANTGDDMTGALEFTGFDETEAVTVADGTYDVYEKVVPSFVVSAAGSFSITNDGEQAVVETDISGNITVTVTGSSRAGTYTTDHLGNPLTTAGVTAAPKCFYLPTVSGNTGDGDVLTVLPGLWISEGVESGTPTLQQQLDGVDVSGGTGLTFTIDLATHSASVFTVEETFDGVTVESAGVTIDTFIGSFMASDTDAKFWYDPENVTVDGSNNLTNWQDSSLNGDGTFDLDTVPTGDTAPVWDPVDKKLTGNGADQAMTTGITSDFFMGETEIVTNGNPFTLFIVMEPAVETPMSGATVFSYAASGTSNNSMATTLGENGSGDLILGAYARKFSNSYGNRTGTVAMNNTVAAGKHILELRHTATDVDVYVDGTLEYSTTPTSGNYSGGTAVTLLARGSDSSTDLHSGGSVYEVFCTQASGTILNDIRSELATKHSITIP